MATTLYFRAGNPPPQGRIGLNAAQTDVAGASRYFKLSAYYADTARGASAFLEFANTVAGPTNGVHFTDSNGFAEGWMSLPLSADVTISGTITFNLRMAESSMSANAAANCWVLRYRASDRSLTAICKTARVTEMALTTEAANNFTATPTSTVFLKGDRILLMPFIDDAGTMGAGFTCSFWYGGPTAGASGDSYVTFTETLTFESAPAAGTTIYLTNNAAGINPGAATEFEMWTARGDAAVSGSTTTVNGPSAGIQWLQSGTAIEWYTKQLSAVTIDSPVSAQLRSNSGATSGNFHAWRSELAVVDADGTNPVLWSDAGIYAMAASTERSDEAWFAAPSLSIADGQRLRLRVFLDDGEQNMFSGQACLLYFDGPTPGASGDSFLVFSQTLTEYTPPVDRVVRVPPMPQLLAH